MYPDCVRAQERAGARIRDDLNGAADDPVSFEHYGPTVGLNLLAVPVVRVRLLWGSRDLDIVLT